ncbi:flagellar brake protein [Fusibacter ferrireducens]|uniref:PilZ domain-containing protein n=1 Tax=Fusibacter ferrireducens TaxID=2785058 RepID=A0ABR9ZT33_9FIRM|nr:PilZ domain-containing protein [Fusibacter ferrireducens]MBF4692764.1 PilZ domain-containing protein [Fusibacter ferrireducens]
MELKNFLLPSRSIEVAVTIEDEDHKPALLRLKTVIETGYENGFFKIVAPMHHGRLYSFRENEIITVTFTTQNDQKREAFDIKCSIVSREHKGNLYTLTLRSTGSPQKVQRRQAFRVNIFNTYTFTYKDKTQQIVTKDISSTGMRGLTTMQMSKGDMFEIQFNANTKEQHEIDPELYAKKIFTIKCRVVDCMPQTEIRRYMQRIQFLEMTSSQNKYLIQYLYAKQAEIIYTEGSDSDQRALMDQYFNSQYDDVPVEDAVTRRIQLFSLISLFVLFLSIVFLLYAQPKPVYGLDRFFDYFRAQAWNSAYYLLSLFSSILNLFIAMYGLILNATKIKTKKDHFNRLLLVTLTLTVVLIFVLLYLFITVPIFTSNKVY